MSFCYAPLTLHVQTEQCRSRRDNCKQDVIYINKHMKVTVKEIEPYCAISDTESSSDSDPNKTDNESQQNVLQFHFFLPGQSTSKTYTIPKWGKRLDFIPRSKNSQVG